MDLPADTCQQLLANVPNGVVFLYEERDDIRYVFVEGGGLDEIGLTKADLEGRPVAEGRPEEIRERIRSKYRSALDGESVTFEVEVEGRHFRFRLEALDESIYVDETADERVRRGVGIAQDVTEQTVYREELERQKERLDRFTELVAHDLRNPLNVAQGHLEMLREECDSDHLDPIEDALDRMEALTDLRVSTLSERDPESLDAVSLEGVATDSWQNVATGDATLDVAASRRIRADEERLRRLFENLFRNAVEHGSTSRADADVSADAVEHGGADVIVRVGTTPEGFFVEDDGPGIPASDREAVFDHGHSGDADGSGLGLFIVDTVAQDHGWTVSVEDSTLGGARFEVSGVSDA